MVVSRWSLVVGRWSLVAVLLAAAAGVASAQPARGVLVTGVVQDQSDAVLVDATVELISGGAVVQTTKTDANGVFRFEGVRSGSYELRVNVDGFAETRTKVRVGSRAPSQQKVVLPLAQLSQEITVSSGGELTASVGSNRDAIVIDPTALENLPIFDQDVVGAASRFLDGGALGTSGVTLIVDGMEARSAGVSASAIEQITINSDPYSAEYARPGRGRIEIITKAGAQDYHGAFNLTFRDAHLNSRDYFASTKPPEQRRIYEGSFGGPVLGGKTTSFLVSFDRREEDLQAIVFAQDLSGIVQANVPQPRRGVQESASINHQQGAKNLISLRYTHEGDSTRNQGVGGTTLPQAASNGSSFEHQVVYGTRTIATKKLLNELRVTIGVEGGSTSSQNATTRIVVLDAFTGGGGQNDRHSSQHRVGLTDTVIYSSGKHFAKAGLNIPEWNRRGNDDFANTLGTFTFSSLQDYQAGRPFSFVQQRGDGRLTYVDKSLGLFVQENWQARPGLSVAMGLRYDWQNQMSDNNNFGPRGSFAYAPGQKRNTVLRGGAGVFYDRLEGGPIADVLHSSVGTLMRSVIVDPSYPNPFAGGGSAATTPPSIVRFDPAVTMPYTVQWGVGVDRQLRKSLTFAVNYVGTRGFNTYRGRDINAPLPPLYAVRPNPAYGVMRQIESTGRQRTQTLNFTLRGRMTKFFDGSVQYALGSARNDTGGVNATPPNSYDLSGEYGRADFDQRHRVDLLGRIAVGKLTNVGVALSIYSGRPYSLRTGRDDLNTGTANARPFGVARNTLEGPGYANLDLRWSHDFVFPTAKKNQGPRPEHSRAPAATFGIDAFNVFNRVNYSSFVGNLSSPFFGRAVSAQPPRRLQLTFRFKF